MITTRFCPSLNGPIHLGHCVTLLMNERFSHSMSGRFFIRFDDVSYNSLKSGRHKEVMEQQREDIEWLGLQIDEWQKDSSFLGEAKTKLQDANFPLLTENERGGYDLCQSIRLGNTFLMYPFAPRQTAERVVIDHMTGITHLIRGDDFITEFSYYHFVSDWMGYDMPEYYCLPRLESNRGDISKTNGGFTLGEFRGNGYTSSDIIAMLEKACLVNPKNGWNFFNFKRSPILAA